MPRLKPDFDAMAVTEFFRPPQDNAKSAALVSFLAASDKFKNEIALLFGKPYQPDREKAPGDLFKEILPVRLATLKPLLEKVYHAGGELNDCEADALRKATHLWSWWMAKQRLMPADIAAAAPQPD